MACSFFDITDWQERPVLDNEVLHNKNILDIFKYPLRGLWTLNPKFPTVHSPRAKSLGLLTTYPWWPKIFKTKCRLVTQSHAPWQITGVSRISTSTEVVCPSCSQHLASLRTSDCTLQAPQLPWHASQKGSCWPTAALVLTVSRLGGIQQWGGVDTWRGGLYEHSSGNAV